LFVCPSVRISDALWILLIQVAEMEKVLEGQVRENSLKKGWRKAMTKQREQ